MFFQLKVFQVKFPNRKFNLKKMPKKYHGSITLSYHRQNEY